MESSGPGSGVFSGILRVRPLPDGRSSIEPPCVSMRTGATKSKRASSEEPALGYPSVMSKRYSVSRVRFLRLRLRARASLVRCFSPGFK